jgi:hypothetical protein
MTTDGQPNRYSVEVAKVDLGWEVRILDPSHTVASTRPCVNEAEARTFASTVAQHIYWLSPAKFREYYRLADPAARS